MELLNRWNEAIRIAATYREQTARYITGEAIAPWTMVESAIEAEEESAAVAA